MIDIHSHILPYTDDGSRSWEMSIDMARQYVEEGYKKVIATPHWIEFSSTSLKKENEERLEGLREKLKEEKIDLEVVLGNEIFINLDIDKYLEDKEASSLGDSKYILIEFSRNDYPSFIDLVLYNLQLKGYRPIIAHPERYRYVWENPNLVADWIEKGALMQMNLPSILGIYGKRQKETAKILLKNNMVHFLATDSHSNKRRSPKAAKGMEEVKKLVAKEVFEDIAINNQYKLLNNEDIKGQEYRRYESERKWFKFWER